jgi:type III restriction enzyme
MPPGHKLGTVGEPVLEPAEGAAPGDRPRERRRELGVVEVLDEPLHVPVVLVRSLALHPQPAFGVLFDVLDAIVARDADVIEAEAKEILTADIRRIRAERGVTELGDETARRAADSATVDDALRHLRRLLTTSIVNKYLSRDMQAAINEASEVGENPSAVDITAIRAHVAALGLINTREGEESVQQAVEDAADALTRLWLTTKAKAITNLPDRRQPTYEAIRDMAREPEPVDIEIKTEEQVDSVDTDRKLLSTARKHVLSDSTGAYPLDVRLNRWERAVIAQETKDDTTVVGWYRNPSSAGKHSLRIVYKDGDSWKSVQPDLILVSRNDEDSLRPSVIDPHGAHLGDALPKLKALAQYADEYGDKFERIIAIGVEKDNALYGINLKDPKVRKAVYESAADTESVKALFEKHGTKYGSLPEPA